MISAPHAIKILLIDGNVYFAKRLSDALKREGFEVTTSTQAAYALTALEYDAPGAILCATNMREMGALEIARIIRADAKNSNLPIVALGDGSQRALMEDWNSRSEEHTSELQSHSDLVCRLLLEKKNLTASHLEQANQLVP